VPLLGTLAFISKTTCYHLLAALICFSSSERIRNLLRRLPCPPLQGKVHIYLLDHIFGLKLPLLLLLKRKLLLILVLHYPSTSNERDVLDVDKDKQDTPDLSNSMSDENMESEFEHDELYDEHDRSLSPKI
jgi:hypothetical protein